jgi:hypothetical protein
MPETTRTDRPPRRPAASVALIAAIVIVGGALIGFAPWLLKKQQWRASVADATATAAKLSTSPFVLAPHQRACMDAVAVTHNSALPTFQLASAAAAEGPPLELLLTAPGYRALAALPAGGYAAHVQFQIRPPRHSVIATACLTNVGTTPIALEGTTALRTTSRSLLTIDGKPVAGNLTLIFQQPHPRTRAADLNEVVEHASNLTDRLVPVWLVWLLAACLVVGLPLGVVVALQRAVREDQAA